MEFQELSLEEKVKFTVNDFKRRDKLAARGKKEADQYRFNNSCKIRNKLRGEKRTSIR